MAILLQTISPSRSNAALKPTLIVTLALMSLTFGCSREKSQSAGDFQKKKECADRAEAYLRHERNIDVPANGINASVKNEQYAYSSALNTCLLYFEAVEVDAGTSYNIVDTLANKTIYYRVRYNNPSTQRDFDTLCKASDGCLGENEFQKKHAELFARSQ